METVGSVKISMWHWFSPDHALAATTFSRKCGKLEAEASLPGSELTRSTEHKTFAVAACFSSVAFLEASINELIAAAHRDETPDQHQLTDDERVTLVDVAEMIEKNSTLDRFQLVLHLLGKEPFDRGKKPYQAAQLLVKLRNALVHYKPQWRPGGDHLDRDADKLAKGLMSQRFTLNPFTGAGNPFFPDKCLGHGCTEWAWTSALALADEFFARLGVTPIYDSYRPRLIS